MTALHRALARYSPWVAIVAVYLVLGLLGRAVLWARFGVPADVGPGRLPYILSAGCLNDLVESLYLFAPFAAYVLLVPDRWFRSTANRVLLHAAIAATIAVLLYLTVAEYYFFEEFDARFNVVAYDYLAYPTEVFIDIRDSYPVAPVLGGAVALAALAMFGLRHWIARGFSHAAGFPHRLAVFAPFAVLLGLAVASYPTDALSRSSNRVENELLQNGHSSFFRAVRTSDIDYEAYYASARPADNLRVLERELSADGSQFTRLAQGRLDRRHAARPDGLGRLNVVVVVIESFGAGFSRLYGSDLDWTPNFDHYANQGLWFSSAYATGTRTVRGLEAIAASFPPIPTVAILHRPGNQGIAGWGKVMNGLGYRSSFLYGGYGYFDDMNPFFAGNGFEVIDRGSIDSPRFANIWGVSDEDLYDRAIRHYDEQYRDGRPFFSIIMTTSNHKPFTFRPGLEGLGIKPEGGGRQSGVRYADHALGHFLRQSAGQPWFDDTIFVVVADHGARVYGKAELPIDTYRIPLLVYSPKHVAARRVDTLVSQLDIAPMVLGLLGLPYEAPFFGVDTLHESASHAPVALFSHNHDVAVLRGDRLEVLGLHKASRTMRYDRASGSVEPAPDDDAALRELGIAYFQTAAALFESHRYE